MIELVVVALQKYLWRVFVFAFKSDFIIQYFEFVSVNNFCFGFICLNVFSIRRCQLPVQYFEFVSVNSFLFWFYLSKYVFDPSLSVVSSIF